MPALACAWAVGPAVAAGAPAPAPGSAAVAPAVTAAPREVLALYSYGRLLPAHADAERGLNEGFAERPDVPVRLAVELLDGAFFGGPDYERAFANHLRVKYAQQRPEVILAGGPEALGFLVRNRATTFPGVPVVYVAVDAAELAATGPLPADFVGTPIVYDFLATVAQARRWHPQARRLIVVTGTNAWDRERETQLRAEAPRLAPGIDVEFLAGLPLDALEHRLRTLPVDSIVYTPGFFRDGAGNRSEPRDAVQAIAAAAAAPVYGMSTTLVGTGIVGGHAVDFRAAGRIAARSALALLGGTAPSSVPAPAAVPTPLHVDWRQLRRWGIPEAAVPADAIVQFRPPSLWEAHRDAVIFGGLVMLLQAALIAALLFQRRLQRRTLNALARSEENLRLAATAAGLSTWVHDAAGARRAADPDFAPPTTDFADTLAHIAAPDRPAVLAALEAARASGGEFAAQYRIEGPDGDWRWQSARGRADPERPDRLRGVAVDATARKRAELQAEQDRAALFRMTRVSMLGQLSASIAHQLNQPLASILGNAEAAQKILEREPVDVAELRAICADVVAADHTAAAVIRRLGALFKRGEPLLEPLDVDDLVRDTMELTRGMLAMRHVAVTTDFAPDLPLVSGDRVQLQQLLLNLIVNAADAMAALPDDRRVLTIRTERHGDALHVCVIDRGAGVSPEAMDKLFEPFWTTKPGGMGIGLAMSRSIAEAHDGSLSFANLATGGAEFCLRLPGRAAP